MSEVSKQQDWTQPAAMAIPKGGFSKDKVEQGRYGPIFPRVQPATASRFSRESSPVGRTCSTIMPKTIEKTVASQPDCLAVLKLHYLRWILFPINGDTYFMYQGIFDTDFDKYTEDAVALFSATGIDTVFENLEGFPKDWKNRPEEFVKFVRRAPVPELPRIRGISTCERRRGQEGTQAQGLLLEHARPDAVIPTRAHQSASVSRDIGYPLKRDRYRS